MNAFVRFTNAVITGFIGVWSLVVIAFVLGLCLGAVRAGFVLVGRLLL